MNDVIETNENSLSQKDSNTWCLFIHLSSFLAYIIPVGGLVAPLVLWQIKKEHDRIDMHGREVMNYTITMIILWVVAFFLSFILIGIPMMYLLGAYSLAVPLIAAVKANEGKFYKYPLIFRFL